MIYFARDVEGGPIKIGFTDNLPVRLKALEYHYGRSLVVLATMDGGRDEEKSIHDRFSHLRFGKTEQFQPASDLLEFIGKPLFASAVPVVPMPLADTRKALAIQVRGTEEWKAWSEKLARFDKRPLASLVEIALSRYATEIGFKDEPPAR